MSIITGTYKIKVEETGRIRVPTDLVEIYGESVWLCLGDGPFIRLYTKEQRDKLVEAITQLNPLDIDEPQVWQLRDFGSSLVEAKIKKKSRIIIPQNFREHVGFDGGNEIVLIGCIQFAEIWKSTEEYNAERKRHREEKFGRSR